MANETQWGAAEQNEITLPESTANQQTRTWGHVMLLVLSIAMLIASLIVSIACAVKLNELVSLVGFETGVTYAAFFIMGLFIAPPVIVPSVVGIVVALKPQGNIVAIVFAIVGLVLVVSACVYLLVSGTATVFATACFAIFFAIPPVIYLVAACKIRRSCIAAGA